MRRCFHENPELAFQEWQTAQRIEEELDSFGLEHFRVGETGVCAILKGSAPGPVLGLRADMDALPIEEKTQLPYASKKKGLMHACGHDVHTACLLGAAKVLSAHQADLRGEVRFFFQQAEEVAQGGRIFTSSQAVQGLSSVFGLHSAPDVPAGTLVLKKGVNNASVDHFTIRIQGKASHVCAPQEGIDALVIACQIVVALQAIATRRTNPIHPVIIGVGKLNAGDAYNIVAKEAILEGTTRLISPQDRILVNELVHRTAKDIARIYGGEALAEWENYTDVLSNEDPGYEQVYDALSSTIGEDTIRTQREVSLSGDDFAAFLSVAPGAYAYLGTQDETNPQTKSPIHSDTFTVNEEALGLGCASYVGYVVGTLQID
ncbi:MAG: amidohydrolase [Blautia sp.]|nr:amidohydrolase [Blautia sp.]